MRLWGRCDWDRPAPAEFPRRSRTWYLKRAELAKEAMQSRLGAGQTFTELVAGLDPER